MKILICTKNEVLQNSWQEAINDEKPQIALNENEIWNFISNNDKSLIFLDIAYTEDIKKLIKDIKENSNARVFILTQKPSFIEGRELLDLKISGYANAYMQEVHFKDAIYAIRNGDIWLYPEFIQSMIKIMTQATPAKEHSKLSELSTREKEVAKLISEGLTNQEIAQCCGITPRTVKAHISAIYSKLEVKDRISLVLLLQS